jgi:hypothetical protein
MANVFDSARLTFVRAKHHADDFKAVIDNFVNDKHWTYVVDRQTQPGQIIHKIAFTSPLPEILPCILFDAASNLRAVLDQTGYAAAIATGKAFPKKTSFPFGKDLTALNNNLDGRRSVCKDIPPEIVAGFRRFKPYKGGNDILWALNKLCNTKKHCSLVPLRIANRSVSIFGKIPAERIPNKLLWDGEKREVTLFTVLPIDDVKVTGHFSFSIAIGGVATSVEIGLRRFPAV